MKKVNFRIVELETHQVLLTNDFAEDEENPFNLVVSFFLDDAKVNLTLGYSDEDIRNKAFNDITNEAVQKFLDNTINQF